MRPIPSLQPLLARALLKGLDVSQSDDDFNSTLDASIEYWLSSTG